MRYSDRANISAHGLLKLFGGLLKNRGENNFRKDMGRDYKMKHRQSKCNSRGCRKYIFPPDQSPDHIRELLIHIQSYACSNFPILRFSSLNLIQFEIFAPYSSAQTKIHYQTLSLSVQFIISHFLFVPKFVCNMK